MPVTREGQTLPITTTTTQGAGLVSSSATPLDNSSVPFVLVVDENNPAGKVPLLGVAQDGVDSTAIGATQATGGTGLRGWLSTLVSLFRTGGAQVSVSGTSLVRLVDAQGNARTAQNPPLVLHQPAGGTRHLGGSVYVRRRVHYTQGYSVAAQSIPTVNAYGTGFSVSDALEILVYASLVGGTGTTPSVTGLKVFVQLYDPQTGTWFDHPSTGASGMALALSGTGSQVAVPATALSTVGDLIRVGAVCTSTSYTGGTFSVMVKDKG